MAFKYKITVFTPTYNRAYIIHTLYESLKRQNFTDFEWLVVDDGSSDYTEELMKRWMKENHRFPIRYFRKENGGKCSAINYALDKAEGELFFTVDSDDYLTDDALQKIVQWEEELPKDGTYCGVAGNLGLSSTDTSNSIFKEGFFDGTFFDRYSTVDGERAIAIYTDIHRRYRYPVFLEEKFMTEAVAWNRMAHDGYRVRFYNDIIWIYEYKEDGLTKAGHKLFINNPRGYCLWLGEKRKFQESGIVSYLRYCYSMVCELKPYYSAKQISYFMQANKGLVYVCNVVCKVKGRIEKNEAKKFKY